MRWRGAAPAATQALELALAELCERGHRAFPDIPLDASDFAGYAGERARPEVHAYEAVRQLHAEDLFLACACARGVPAALDTFDRDLLARIPRYVRKLHVSPEIERETRQVLLDKLFVGAN